MPEDGLVCFSVSFHDLEHLGPVFDGLGQVVLSPVRQSIVSPVYSFVPELDLAGDQFVSFQFF